jgi:hypothetical protein
VAGWQVRIDLATGKALTSEIGFGFGLLQP